MTPLLTPTVNHNGTSRRDLIKQRRDASVALHAVILALRSMTPHGRDYPTGADAFQTDRDIHWARIGTLAALRDAIIQEAAALGDD